MTVKEHYDNHLGHFYSWMAGDFDAAKKKFAEFLSEHKIAPHSTKTAIDLGAGHGVQSAALAELGYTVTAVDFSEPLLRELDLNTMGMSVHIVRDDIRAVRRFEKVRPELVVCWGDTLTHLSTKDEIRQLLSDMSDVLEPGGLILMSFRDYSAEPAGEQKFIPVKSDDTRILTCVLNYRDESVLVTDLFHEKAEQGWQLKTSSYAKIRIPPGEVKEILQNKGLVLRFSEFSRGMVSLIAEKR